MNTNAIIALVAGLVIIGGGAYYVMKSDSVAVPAGNSANETMNVQNDGAFSGSIVALSEHGGEWKCTVDTTSQTGGGQAVSSGIVYVSDNKVRADFDVSVAGRGAMKAYMIADGEYVYSWSSMVPQGVKVAQAQAESSQGAATSGQGMDANTSYSYDCQPSSADASLFVPPSNVTFMAL